MRVLVKFAGTMRTLSDCDQMYMSLDKGATLCDLFEILKEKLPELFVRQVISPLQGNDAITFLMVNQVHIHDSSFFKNPLSDGDTIVFVPPMAGG
jgi:molybdopterin converting factor small subunit